MCRCCCNRGASTRGGPRRGTRMPAPKFEDCLARLEQIVGKLEAGNLPLEESLTIFEEGVGLAPSCSRYLEEAGKRLEGLARDDSGGVSARPFMWEPEKDA